MSPDHPVDFEVDRRRRHAPGHHRHAAGGGADRAAPERRRPRLPAARPAPTAGRVRGGARQRRPTSSMVRVIDDGVGLPDGFSVDAATGLGLSIVRTLVTTELHGTIDMFEPPRRPRHRWTGPLERRPGAARRDAGRGASSAADGLTRGERRLRRRGAGGQPLPAELAALLLGGAAPDARVLVGGQGELQARALRVALLGRRPWRSRSARWPGRSCRPGRTGRDRCPGMRRSSRHSSDAKVRDSRWLELNATEDLQRESQIS